MFVMKYDSEKAKYVGSVETVNAGIDLNSNI